MSKKTTESRLKLLENKDHLNLGSIILGLVVLSMLAIGININRDSISDLEHKTDKTHAYMKAEESYTSNRRDSINKRIDRLEELIIYQNHLDLFREYQHIMGYTSFKKCHSKTCFYKKEKLMEDLTLSEVHDSLEKAKIVLARQKAAQKLESK